MKGRDLNHAKHLMAEADVEMGEDEDEGVSSDDGRNSPGRNARLDREMADLIRERDKFLAYGDGITKKRVSRVTKQFQYRDHDDRLREYPGRHRPGDDSAPSSRYNDRQRRRRNIQTYPPLYDDTGIHLNSNRDLCDCLDTRCPGCHEECKGCGSQKCGFECRSGRTWSHREVIQFHPHKPKEIIRSRPV